MKQNPLSLTLPSLALASGALLSFALLSLLVGERAALAQSAPQHNSTTEGFNRNESDPLFGEGSENFNPFDLIHNANFRNGRTMGDFRRDTSRQLNRASEEFRRQQLELILQQQQNNSATETAEPVETPEN